MVGSSLHIVGLSGSPRAGGNTDYAVQMALEELSHLEGVITEFLRIADYRIAHCRGCRRCMEIKQCVIRDDEQGALEDKLRRADVVIIGAPVYWYAVPGVCKDFLDRAHGHYLGERFLASKLAALITVAADSGFEEVERSVTSWLQHFGAKVIGTARVLATDLGDLPARPAQLAKVNALAAQIRDQLTTVR